MFVLFDLLQSTGDGVDDEASDGNVFGDERMGLDGLDGLADGGLRVSEALEPVVEVDAALADDIQCLVFDTPRFHDVVKMAVTHVARAALGVCDYHDLLHAEFINRHYEAAHRGVKGRDNQSAGVLDDLGIAVL